MKPRTRALVEMALSILNVAFAAISLAAFVGVSLWLLWKGGVL